MELLGESLIGAHSVKGDAGEITATDMTTGNAVGPHFGGNAKADLDRACGLAEAAFDPYRALPLEQRATFLEAIAQAILDLGDDLIQRCMQESGLPRPRLEGERGRTVGQLRLFAQVVRDGGFLDVRIDPALPERKPLPRPDLRLRNIPLGPVAVFGASNFPLAFSVAGGDTASALAAGCPVVAKAHSAHPERRSSWDEPCRRRSRTAVYRRACSRSSMTAARPSVRALWPIRGSRRLASQAHAVAASR